MGKSFRRLSISLRPAAAALRKVFGVAIEDIEHVAAEHWTVAAPEKIWISRSICLSGQYERIRGTEFGSMDHVIGTLKGGIEALQRPVTAFMVRDVHIVDGVLFSQGAERHLRPRHRFAPAVVLERSERHGSFYESWVGSRWFGSWLMMDCVSYRLAAAQGHPISISPPASGHACDYERRLGMDPLRLTRAHIEEAYFFLDGDGSHRRSRMREMRTLLVGNSEPEPHNGVFLLRGDAGDRRLLRNEAQLAEQLAARRGFRIIDPLKCSLEEIINACAGARVVAGVEGSQLVHGLMLMPADACLLVLQPPSRVVSVLKMLTDLQGQTFAFIVGEGSSEEFTLNWRELDATLDLPGIYR